MAERLPRTAKISGGVAERLRHDSAHKHVAGEALYTDDIAEPRGLLHAFLGQSSIAHGVITSMDLSAVRAAPGVRAVLTADDIPGVNDVGPVIKDDPLFAQDVVEYVGQPIFAVIADSQELARRAAHKARVTYDEREAAITIADARRLNLRIEEDQIMARGDSRTAMAGAPHQIAGRLVMGGQDHFYLEGQIALAVPGEDGDMHLTSSTQHPSEVQHLVAHVLDAPTHSVTVEVRRMGGGFGGKETQPALLAAASALGARITGKPVKLRLDRDDDMIITGKRHDFEADYRVGFDDDGRLIAVEIDLASRCGRSTDLSMAINDRALFHADNCYFCADVTYRSARFRTHTVSNTAFRGFGGPQGMLVAERIMDHIARQLGKDPFDIRRLNLYGLDDRNVTPYGMTIEDNVAPQLMDQLLASSDYRKRRAQIDAFNAGSPILKRGLAMTPVRFGISFTTTFLNQAGALIHVYRDGSVHLNHGGTEMGQGLFVKVAQVVAEEFQIDIARIKITATDTGKVPNTSATAASSGSDLNGMAAREAARTIKARLIDFASRTYGCPSDSVRFEANQVHAGNHIISFDALVDQAYLDRVSLSSTGFYKTPKIQYDRKTHTGRPFYYFAYGTAVSEVIIDTLTGENRLLAVDILHDVGRSLNPAIDEGQIEGGFLQGMGWLTMEELVWNSAGKLMTHAPSTYKIPTASDRPDHFRLTLLDNENREDTIHKSKAVGEPPFMLANSVFSAILDALGSLAPGIDLPPLDAPATPERILMAARHMRSLKQSEGP